MTLELVVNSASSSSRLAGVPCLRRFESENLLENKFPPAQLVSGMLFRMR